MSNQKKNTGSNKDFEKQTDAFFGKAEIPFNQTKDDVWKKVEDRLEKTTHVEKSIVSKNRLSFAIAASIVLLAGIFSIVRFYTTTITSHSGQHLSVNLPDGSTVILNAESQLSYQPLWWQFSRHLHLEGEGFFKVEKGKKFTVKSVTGKTEVLGTSFNIYARDQLYEVICKTGKVKVTSPENDAAVLSPGYTGRINKEGKVVVFKPEKPENTISWIDNKFIFTGTPLTQVFKEIERQYNVRLTIPVGLDYYYTGYFTKDIPVQQVLDLICKPFGLTFVAEKNGSYTVVKK